MDYLILGFLFATLAINAYALFGKRKAKNSPSSTHVYVGDFTNSLPSDFYDRMVVNYSQSQEAFDALAAWLKHEYVMGLEALRTETDSSAYLRHQGTCQQAMKTYNIVETVRAESRRRSQSK